MSLALSYYIAIAGGTLGVTIAKPEDYIAGIRLSVYEQFKRLFEHHQLDKGALILYAPPGLKEDPEGDRHQRVETSIRSRSPLELEDQVRDIFRANKLDSSLIHFVVAVRPVTVPRSVEWDYARADWKVEEDSKWQKFFDYWRKKDHDETFNLPVIPLAFDEHGSDDPDYRLSCLTRSKGQILVLKSYRSLFQRVLGVQKHFSCSGIVLTGQPGSGKTTWLWFMLICFITKGEAVAFYTGGRTRLFYDSRVYYALKGSTPAFPPSSTQVWCLIDSDRGPEPPPIDLVCSWNDRFPVQASSPDKERYREWVVKQRSGVILGMPLWTEEELIAGFKLHESYIPLLNGLQGAFETPPDESVLAADSALESAWEVATDPKFSSKFGSDAERVLLEVLRSAIKSYGNAPRDVYAAIFDRNALDRATNETLINASRYEFMNAMSLVAIPSMALSALAFSYKLFAITVKPTKSILASEDEFVADFKSKPIGEQVMEQLGHLQRQEAQALFGLYRSLPQSTSLAGWIFEGLAHAPLSSMDSTCSLSGPLIPMHSDNSKGDAPRFFTLPESPQPSSSPSLWLSHPPGVYTVVDFDKQNLLWPPSEDYGHSLEHCFCVPKAPNNPLFDSFFVEFNTTKGSVTPVVWIFQTTTVPQHDGLEQGYPLIRSITSMASERACELVLAASKGEEDGVEMGGGATRPGKRKRLTRKTKRVMDVKLKYVLLCPSSEVQHSWNMPRGWTKAVKGEVFCQFINVPHYGTL